jgi:hypothetical protein
LGPSISCEVLSAEGFQQGFSSLPPKIAEELFKVELADSEICSSLLSAELKRFQTATITFDNALSPAHTLVQIICAHQKGLIYDILRTMKDCNIQVAGALFMIILLYSSIYLCVILHHDLPLYLRYFMGGSDQTRKGPLIKVVERLISLSNK